MTLNTGGTDTQEPNLIVVDSSRLLNSAQTNDPQVPCDGSNATASEPCVPPYYEPSDQPVSERIAYTIWTEVKAEITGMPLMLLLLFMAPFMLRLTLRTHEESSLSNDQRQRQLIRRQRSISSELQLTSPTTTTSPLAIDTPSYKFRVSTCFPQPWRKIIDRLCSTLFSFAPLWLPAVWVTLVVGIGSSSKQDTTSCLTREHEEGFRGNSDIYGLGVRLGIYHQWIAATFAMCFMPSARHMIAGSYALSQVGMLAAVCLLILPKSCTFNAEMSIVLQLLWGGAALAYMPLHMKRKSFAERSRHIRLEVMFVVIGIAIFAIVSWFSLRLWLHDGKDFIESPGGVTEFYIFRNVRGTGVGPMRRFRG